MKNLIQKSVIKYHFNGSFELWTIVPIISLLFIFSFIIYYEVIKSNNKNKKFEENIDKLIIIQE